MNTENFSTKAIRIQERDIQTTMDNSQILVFRSNINSPEKAALVQCELLKMKNVQTANVDLHDWENILRVECYPELRASQVVEQLDQVGFRCEELTD